jgi:hypothetical protein
VSKESTPLFLGQPSESKTIVVGKTDLLCVYAGDTSYETVLRALSFRDYLEKEEGLCLPVLMYNPDISDWIGLTTSRQRQIIFSFVHICDRQICECHTKACDAPSLPHSSPTSMSLNLKKYIEVTKQAVDTATCHVDQIRFVGAWKCMPSDLLTSIFIASDLNDLNVHYIWSLIEMAIIER